MMMRLVLPACPAGRPVRRSFVRPARATWKAALVGAISVAGSSLGTLFAADSVVVFNEVQYHPPLEVEASEWIELHNEMAVDIDLSAWRLAGGVSYSFPEGTVIPGGGYLVITGAPPAGVSVPEISGAVGPFDGRLNNAGERLELRDRNNRLMDRLEYQDQEPWPVGADGSGATLAKRDPNRASQEAEDWASSILIGGTPGRSNFPVAFTERRVGLVSLDALWRFEASGIDLGTAWREREFDDGGWGGHNAATLASYWPLDGTAGAAYGADGVLNGGAPASDRNGRAGGAVAFEGGRRESMTVAGGGGLNGAAEGTIALWVQWTGMQDADCCGSFGAVLARQGNGLFSDNILALTDPDPARARIVWRQSGGPAPFLITGSRNVGTGWHHVAVTFAPTGSVLYVDGVAEGFGTGAPLHDNAGVALSVGAWIGDGDGYATATLDDLAVWERPLEPAQIAQLATGQRSPLEFGGPENAVYFAGDGRLASGDEWRRTALPLGPITHYFRTTFEFEDDPALAELGLDFAADDGAVFYLNGREVYRHNLPAGVVSYSTLASAAVGDAPLLTGVRLAATALERGTNVLAVEVHQAAANDLGMVFGAALMATLRSETNQPQDLLPGDLAFNEVGPVDGVVRVELVNRAREPLSLEGYVIQGRGSAAGGEFELPSESLAAGGFWSADPATLGFTVMPGDRLFLLKPGRRAVADAVLVPARVRGRWPDGGEAWWFVAATTFGAANVVELNTDIVINEILYHAPPILEAGGTPFRENPDQWIELFNRGSNRVSLAGWRLDDAVAFRFGSNAVMSAGDYLVVASDPVGLLAQWPGTIVVGPFTGRLSFRSDRIVLRDARDNPADVVRYFDGGRWPEAADGGGSSLELRDPFADNTAPEAWAASDERARSSWQTYSYRGVARPSAVGPDGQWHEFVLGLLGAGEVLLDDLSVIESPDTQPVEMLQNGTFTPGTNSWRILGNHRGEVIDDPDQPGNRVLRLTATGGTEHMSNHAETTFVGNRDVVNGREYLIRFRAKWLWGSRQLHTRLYFNRLARTTLLDAPRVQGTPGRPNPTRVPNLGPTFARLRHDPPVPAPATPVAVRVEAADPDGVADLTLHWRTDGGSWQSTAMGADLSAPGSYVATLPGRPARTVVQFYAEGRDGLGAVSTIPAAGPASHALYQVDDGLEATNGLHTLRLITLTADANRLHDSLNVMSNDRIGTTMIYDREEIFYDLGLRLKGSEHSRTTSERLGFNLDFPRHQLFRGIHRTVAIDRSESTGFGQREMLIHQTMNHAGGVPTKYHDLIRVIAPRPEHTGSAELQLARYSDVFLEDQYPDGSEGTVFEYELIYQLNHTHNGSPEGLKVPAPDSVVGTPIRSLGTDKEAYRWTYLIKNNEERDDYRRLMAFCDVMGRSGTAFLNGVTNVIDVDQWLRGVAVNVLSGAGDNYGGDGSQHNVQFYVRPDDGRVLFFPHDVDAFFEVSRPFVPNGDIAKLIAVPAYARAYYAHVLDILTTTYNRSYLTRWANHYGRLLPGQDFAGHLAFIVQRAALASNWLRSAVPTVPFAISNNGGTGFTTTNHTVTLTGTAPLGVWQLEVNGTVRPVTWSTTTAWAITVPLAHGVNELIVRGLDASGQPIADRRDAITVTNTGPGALAPVVINEWMADNAGPDGVPDPADGRFQDWFELYNPNVDPVDLSGYHLSDDPAQPRRWTLPGGTVIGPHAFLLVWADNQPEQNASSTPGQLHAPFQLNADGETIVLSAPDGTIQSRVVFGRQYPNLSQGCFPDGDTNRIDWMPVFTPGAPNSDHEPLRVTSITVADGMVGLVWSTVPGRTYQLEATADIGALQWTAVGDAVTADRRTAAAFEPVEAATPRFYRVLRFR